ncbi:hypothetical protein DEVEQU_02214 [Devosia equisanguinis]|uniref:DNA alkylation repair protein n=1 Tax=Devosia equisanguinis TaxID=2490941 RepID=A0A3S4EM06_9HYPH|nr:DNA alkylation repair protein [Devosia equisanguinis]VDS05073.1 hypothetical protein DEVEQU_02214 [Devosia equisanguinis]
MSQRISDIQPDRLDAMNSGTVEATTLTECLAVDFAALMSQALPDLGETTVTTMRAAANEGISRRMALAGRMLHEAYGRDAIRRLGAHPSDTVRGWACFTIGEDTSLDLASRLDLIRPLADDSHFGVREWAWMAVRPHLAAEIETAIALLAPWTTAPSERIRRFGSEATRPRGVWCAHIETLKHAPEIALPLLEPLRADQAAYVQDSVGNWLNDASKTRADWVQEITARWASESTGPATARICKRALRSLGKLK